MERIYDYDLPLRVQDLTPHNPEAHAAVKEYQRKEKLYSMATLQLESYQVGQFAALASRGEGPNIRLNSRPHLLSYCIQVFAVEFVDDLLALGVDPRQPGIASDMMGADQDARDYYNQIINRR